jgi:hypothetical protein
MPNAKEPSVVQGSDGPAAREKCGPGAWVRPASDGSDQSYGDAFAILGSARGRNDALSGNDGNDTLCGDTPGTDESAQGGADTLAGGADDDLLVGAAFEIIRGAQGGDDVLFGGNGLRDEFYGDGCGWPRAPGAARTSSTARATTRWTAAEARTRWSAGPARMRSASRWLPPRAGWTGSPDFASAEGDRAIVVLAAFDPGGVLGLSAGSFSAQASHFAANAAGGSTLAGVAQLAFETGAGGLFWGADGQGGAAGALVATFAGVSTPTAADIWLA